MFRETSLKFKSTHSGDICSNQKSNFENSFFRKRSPFEFYFRGFLYTKSPSIHTVPYTFEKSAGIMEG